MPVSKSAVIAALHTVYDPEIPVDIYELGLIYDLKVNPSGAVAICMTLTSPGCPVAGSLPGEVRSKVQSVPGVTSATVELVWEPPWSKERMSEAANWRWVCLIEIGVGSPAVQVSQACAADTTGIVLRRPLSQAVRQRIANPPSPVRIREGPLPTIALAAPQRQGRRNIVPRKGAQAATVHFIAEKSQ